MTNGSGNETLNMEIDQTTNPVDGEKAVEESSDATKTTVVPTTSQNVAIPDKFDGTSYKMWKNKMRFYLTTLKLDKYISEDKPILPPDNTDARVLATVHAWEHSDYLCKGYILSRLSDPLYNVYINVATSKELWELLDKKYRADDAGSQKFAVSKFQSYTMVDSRPLMDQFEECQNLLHEVEAEGMKLCETFQVAAMIEKLPPSWKDFKNYLNMKRKWMSMQDLAARLRVESSGRKQIAGVQIREPNANVVEHKQNKQYKGRQNKGKGKAHMGVHHQNVTKFKKMNLNKSQTGQTSTRRFNGSCHFCGKPGHKVADCRAKKAQANFTQDDMCAVVTEANVAESHPKTWWFDTGATRHICMDREMFSSYTKNKSDDKLFMGNSATSKIEGHGKVVLKLTSGRELTLNNVVHVPDMRKNLLSGALLSKHGFAMRIEADKMVLSKNGMYLGKGFVCDGLFKMSVENVIRNNVVTEASTSKTKKMNGKNPIAYVAESFNIWHEH